MEKRFLQVMMLAALAAPTTALGAETPAEQAQQAYKAYLDPLNEVGGKPDAKHMDNIAQGANNILSQIKVKKEEKQKLDELYNKVVSAQKQYIQRHLEWVIINRAIDKAEAELQGVAEEYKNFIADKNNLVQWTDSTQKEAVLIAPFDGMSTRGVDANERLVECIKRKGEFEAALNELKAKSKERKAEAEKTADELKAQKSRDILSKFMEKYNLERGNAKKKISTAFNALTKDEKPIFLSLVNKTEMMINAITSMPEAKLLIVLINKKLSDLKPKP